MNIRDHGKSRGENDKEKSKNRYFSGNPYVATPILRTSCLNSLNAYKDVKMQYIIDMMKQLKRLTKIFF